MRRPGLVLAETQFQYLAPDFGCWEDSGTTISVTKIGIFGKKLMSILPKLVKQRSCGHVGVLLHIR